ncbi:hypothetical protein TWF281_001227 [Arthrobotrys megalospora]
MPFHKGIVCTVDIDGVPAEEFGIETDGPNTTCNIVAPEDKPFLFNLDFSQSTARRHDYNTYADGIEVSRLTTTERTATVSTTNRVYNGLLEKQEMRFSKLETVDQKLDNLETRVDVLKNVGSLTMKIWRAEKNATEASSKDWTRLSEIENIHEKALKGRAVSHKTLLGAVTYEPSRSCRTRKLDPEDSPYVTFIFRYASKRYLQIEGLMPRSPSPEHSTKGSDDEPSVEEMSPEELRREVLRHRAGNRVRPIKRELEASPTPRDSVAGNDDEVTFQSERSVKKQKTIEVIDLLDDD